MMIRKIIFIAAAVWISVPLMAQLKNTQWKGVIKGDNPRGVILDFKSDSCYVYNVADSSLVESMTYTLDGNTFTVKKIEGQSDCDNSTPGKYKFAFEDGRLLITLLDDHCSDRSSALDNTRWMKWKAHKEVKVSEAILKQYVGQYEPDPSRHFYITLENGRLQIEGPNNNLPKSPMLAESNSKFFIPVAGVEIDFVKDASGKVIKFVSHEDTDFDVKKVK